MQSRLDDAIVSEFFRQKNGQTLAEFCYQKGKADAFKAIATCKATFKTDKFWIVDEAFFEEHDKQVKEYAIDECIKLVKSSATPECASAIELIVVGLKMLKEEEQC